MAHTLKAYYYTDPATAVTVDFYGAVSDNDGIAVTSYQMGVPGIEQARNSSLYSDYPRPVYSKHGTVTDVLMVDVRGSTNTNLYTNLHLLAKLGEYARVGTQNPYVKATPYLELKPGGSAAGEVLYAPIYACRVELPPDWANTVDARLTIEDVTVTIERGLWQQTNPPAYTDGTTGSLALNGVALAGSASSGQNVGGDTTSLFNINFFHLSGATTVNRAIIGYRSKALGGTDYASLGIREAESQTNGTNTSDAVDATASGGNKVECTFATTTIATRLSGTGIPYGVHRVFARMKITGDINATVNIKYQDNNTTGVSYVANSSVTVSSTSWLVYDMGIVRYYQDSPGAIGSGSYTGLWALDALRYSGTSGNLDVDWLFFMPTEGYITVSGFSQTWSGSALTTQNIYIENTSAPGLTMAFASSGTTTARIAAIQHTASIAPIPGPFAIYWLMGTDSGDVFDVGITTVLGAAMYFPGRFLMPSEV